MKQTLAIIISIGFIVSCSKEQTVSETNLFVGADLSYVNEMLDCGGEYRLNGSKVEPFKLFADKGANIVRVRLWHNPSWTNYSNLNDVIKTIGKAKMNNMKVLLDFHYSDTWADPQQQIIPAAWSGITDKEILGDSLYNYTYNVLMKLNNIDLLPEFVQVGNEINSEILLEVTAEENGWNMNWERNSYLINRGLKAVRDVSLEVHKTIESMLHIAQPENALWWFHEALQHGITDFDWIGLSYYPNWSDYSIDELEIALDSLISAYDKKIMIVETAYPHSFNNIDEAGNILGEDAIIPGYPATPKGQLDYMINLTQAVINGGGKGIIYWEPAWISTDCRTQWGRGSHWENATFFDEMNRNEALEVFDFLTFDYNFQDK